MNSHPLRSNSFSLPKRWFHLAVHAGVILLSSPSMIAQTCVPPPAGLISWWQAEGNALDALGTNNGTLQGNAAYGPGEVGVAFSFDSASGTMIVPDSPSLRLTSQLTLEAWINTQRTNSSSPDQEIIGKVGGAAGNNGYAMALSGNKLVAEFNSAGQAWPGRVISTPVPIAPGTWNHVAFNYDQSAMTLYFNGQPVATNVIGPVMIIATNANLHISGDDNNHAYFAGLIDEPSVYNRALSASEIAAIYNAGSAGKCNSTPPGPPFIASQPVSQTVPIGSNATFRVVAGGSAPLSYQWTLNGTNLAAGTSLLLTITNVQLSDAGPYAVQVTNLYGSTSSSNATLIVHVPATVYVDVNSPGPAAPYASWSTAATNIQDAVNAAVVGDLILVTNGVYQYGGQVVYGAMTNRVAVTQPLTVQSVNGPGVTTIRGNQVAGITNGDAAVRCVYLTNGAVLAGFTLANGGTRNTYLADYVHEMSGGGVWCESSSAVVTNCALAGNSAAIYGGGAYQGTINHCTLSRNQAGSAGGGVAYCTLNNCLLTANAAYAVGGGALYSILNNCLLTTNSANSLDLVETEGGGAANCTLNNCTLTGNSSINAGDITGSGAYESTLNNCILYYNHFLLDGYVGPEDDYLSCTLNYCCTTPLPSGGIGNFTNPPLFVNLTSGDFHLQSSSPCINAGNNAYVVGATDLDGNARISGATVDVGAYEFQNPASIISYDWLMQYGLPTDGSADFVDSDGDGMNNWQEWIAGTDPTNPNSVLKMLDAVPSLAGTNVTVSWSSVSNRSYYLQRAYEPDINGPAPFSILQSNISGLPGVTLWTDTNALVPGAFYRVGVQ